MQHYVISWLLQLCEISFFRAVREVVISFPCDEFMSSHTAIIKVLIFFEQLATILNFDQMGGKPPRLITNQSPIFLSIPWVILFLPILPSSKNVTFIRNKTVDTVEDELKNEFAFICRLKIWSTSRLFELYGGGILHSRCSHIQEICYMSVVNYYSIRRHISHMWKKLYFDNLEATINSKLQGANITSKYLGTCRFKSLTKCRSKSEHRMNQIFIVTKKYIEIECCVQIWKEWTKFTKFSMRKEKSKTLLHVKFYKFVHSV